MSAQEFYKRCFYDAKYFFEVYFIFLAKLNDYEERPIIKNKAEDSELELMDEALLLFLIALSNISDNIKSMFNLLKVDLEKYYDIPKEIYIELAMAVATNNNVNDKARETFYYNEDTYTSIIKKCIPSEIPRFSLERILLNITERYISKCPELMEIFKMDNMLPELERIAKEKERNQAVISARDKNGNVDDALNIFRDKDNLKPADMSADTLDIGEELTTKEYAYNPLVGRQKEMRKFGAYLLDKKKSVILRGEPGVGKTTMLDGLAYQIQKGEVHPLLQNKRIFSISAAEMVAGTDLRGSFEKKMLKIIHKMLEMKNAILSIDEIHTVMGGGTSGDKEPIDISNMLKPYVGNGKLKIIGITTINEYKKIAKDGAFARRFKTITIPPLAREEIITLLKSQIEYYENSTGIKFPFTEEEKHALLTLLIDLENPKYQTFPPRYNPDLALTALSNGYDLAEYDRKQGLSLDYLIEGVLDLDSISPEGSAYFERESRKRVR